MAEYWKQKQKKIYEDRVEFEKNSNTHIKGIGVIPKPFFGNKLNLLKLFEKEE